MGKDFDFNKDSKSTNKPILVVDLDNTITDLNSTWIAKYNELYDKDIKVEDLTDWELTKTPGVDVRIYKILTDMPEIFLDVKPMSGALETLRELSKYFDIQIVSACNPDAIKYKLQWVEKYLPFIPKHNFNSVYNKYIIKGDVMVDDKPDNMFDFDGKALLFNAPHNHDDCWFDRVFNWDSVYISCMNYINEFKYKFKEVRNYNYKESFTRYLILSYLEVDQIIKINGKEYEIVEINKKQLYIKVVGLNNGDTLVDINFDYIFDNIIQFVNESKINLSFDELLIIELDAESKNKNY